MKFVIFFIYVPFVYSELHCFITTYTGNGGEREVAGITEFFVVTTLDGRQINYNSNKGMPDPKQDWMKLLYINNIPDLIKQFSQSDGVHVYQRMYGCELDDETDVSRGFDEYGYDGEDFISLDLENSRYNTSVPQAQPTVEKWNNDREQLESLKKFYRYKCIYWLDFFLRKLSLEKKAPEVTLLQKSSSSPVVCHATGFYPSGVTLTWRKNGQDHNNVKIGDTLPNEDGTFQKYATLNVLQDVWKKDQYVCVVEHINLTEPIQKILTEDEIKSNNQSTIPTFVNIILAFIAFFMLVFAPIILWIYRNEFKSALFTGYKKVRTFI